MIGCQLEIGHPDPDEPMGQMVSVCDPDGTTRRMTMRELVALLVVKRRHRTRSVVVHFADGSQTVAYLPVEPDIV